jgi:hypothetical protein
MVDADDARLAALVLRARSGELTLPEDASRRGRQTRAEAHSMLFTALGDLPDSAQDDLFGPVVQRVLYVYYEEGPAVVGTVLDPPVSVHAPTERGLEGKVIEYVAEHRGVVEADVHAFGKRVDREIALGILAALLADSPAGSGRSGA